ncbi:unnamed protein product [Haemonchus placei]|uniref:Aldo_ket_red domain-containing protein n=1 Tax=Haemonchus placei TaxID=6290 RepID=A0A0N4WJ42_HAEPC|nr:unnamed protein product [Haemonchus placei]
MEHSVEKPNDKMICRFVTIDKTLQRSLPLPIDGGTSSPAEVKTAVKAAIEAGYRLIDTAAIYQNEEAIGEAIKELIQAGKITRDDLFITTKLWVTRLHPDDVEGALRESLGRLQMSYVNLYLIHAPTCFNILLRYVMNRNIAVIPKSVNPTRIIENFQVFDFTLTDEDMRLLDESVKQHRRLFIIDFMAGHPEDPFASERKQ